MRKLMWFTIGFAAVCGLMAYLPMESFWVPALLCAAALTAGGFLLGRKFRVFYRCALVLLGCAAGLFWFGRFHDGYLVNAAAMNERTEQITIRSSDYSFETNYGIAVDGVLTLDGKKYQVRTYLNTETPLEPGYFITGSFRLRCTLGETYHPGDGIFLLAYQRGEETIGKAAQENWQDFVARFRQKLKDVLHACFPADAVPFAQALLLGDTSELDYETDTDFKVSGVRHVVAVSGLHVSILFALLSAVAFRKKLLMGLLGFPVLFLFAALAGFSPSVTRACIMAGLMLLAMLANREYDGATALSFAALVMLVCNPMVITSVSFQLSVASVAGIYLFRLPIQNWMLSVIKDPRGKGLRHILIKWVTTSVSITLSAMTLTTPLCAYYFGMVSLVGVVTNLLALWVISIIFYGIMAVCLLYGASAGGAAVLAKAVSWPIRYVLLVAETMADFPLAAVYMNRVYNVMWLVFVYVLLVVFLIDRNRSPKQLFCCGVLGLCFALLASSVETSETKITVLDVGQGQSILLQSGGNSYLVDCGGDSDSEAADLAAEALLSQGITELDGLILTHLDRDHAGGAEELLSRVDTKLLVLPEVHNSLEAVTDGEVVYAAEDLRLTAGDTVITIYAPTFPGTSNEMSLCVLFDTEKCDILITGDRDDFGERMLLRNADLPDVDILIAGHHGSKYSTSEELLNAVTPEIVCISVGENSYGHPAPELLERLAQYGCTVYRTDRDGIITIRR